MKAMMIRCFCFKDAFSNWTFAVAVQFLSFKAAGLLKLANNKLRLRSKQIAGSGACGSLPGLYLAGCDVGLSAVREYH
jgi:hypothetical protein